MAKKRDIPSMRVCKLEFSINGVPKQLVNVDVIADKKGIYFGPNWCLKFKDLDFEYVEELMHQWDEDTSKFMKEESVLVFQSLDGKKKFHCFPFEHNSYDFRTNRTYQMRTNELQAISTFLDKFNKLFSKWLSKNQLQNEAESLRPKVPKVKKHVKKLKSRITTKFFNGFSDDEDSFSGVRITPTKTSLTTTRVTSEKKKRQRLEKLNDPEENEDSDIEFHDTRNTPPTTILKANVLDDANLGQVVTNEKVDSDISLPLTPETKRTRHNEDDDVKLKSVSLFSSPNSDRIIPKPEITENKRQTVDNTFGVHVTDDEAHSTASHDSKTNENLSIEINSKETERKTIKSFFVTGTKKTDMTFDEIKSAKTITTDGTPSIIDTSPTINRKRKNLSNTDHELMREKSPISKFFEPKKFRNIDSICQNKKDDKDQDPPSLDEDVNMINHIKQPCSPLQASNLSSTMQDIIMDDDFAIPTHNERKSSCYTKESPTMQNKSYVTSDSKEENNHRVHSPKKEDQSFPRKTCQSGELSPKKHIKNPYKLGVNKVCTKKKCDSSQVGLRNLGNTCYLNSTLQMLFSIPGFLSDLNDAFEGYELSSKESNFAMPLTKTLLDLAKALKLYAHTTQSNIIISNNGTNTSSNACADPSLLKKQMDTLTDKFLGYEQRDAHEFLSDLIDMLHDELEKALLSKKSLSNEEEGPTPSLTDKYFRFDVNVCLQCDSCGYSRSKKEMYRHLSIDVGTHEGNDNKSWTIEDGINQFFRSEKRDIKCEKCSDGISATQSMEIATRPNIILLHLKRFILVSGNPEPKEPNVRHTDSSNICFRKNKVRVQMKDSLNIDRFCKTHSNTYKLLGVVNHIGSTSSSGHYTSVALRDQRSPTTSCKEWAKFDDASVSKCALSEILDNEKNQRSSYLVLYGL